MSQWSTLNKGVTALVKDAVELQVERLLETYQSTLKLQQKGQTQLARQRYEELLSKDLIKKEPKPKKTAGSKSNVDHIEESPLSTLRFLVFKNYALLLKDEFMSNLNNEELANKAINIFLQAVKIDPSDHSLWYFIGYLSRSLKKLRFARLAFETGFYMSSNQRILKLPSIQPEDPAKIINNNKYTPMQWKCLEGLCQVLFDIGDDRLCEFYINITLKKYPAWGIGNELKLKLEEQGKPEPFNGDDMYFDMHPDPIYINIEKPDWSILMKSLLQEYKRMAPTEKSKGKDSQEENKQRDFINQQIQIFVEEEEEPIPVEEPSQTMEDVEVPAAVQHMEEETTQAVFVSDKPIIITETLNFMVQTNSESGNNLVNSQISNQINDQVNSQVNGHANGDVSTINVNTTTANTTTANTTNENTTTENTTDVIMDIVENGITIPAKRKHDDAEEGEGQGTDTAKNDASDHENSENDGEDEAEEKRLSLRASKRARDKIANEETSRLKMLDEEKVFSEKIQTFYNQVKDIPTLNRGDTPWYQTTEDSMSLFWEWFDSKISELDNRYAWAVDTSKKLNTFTSGKGAGKQTLTLFTRSQNKEDPAPDTKNELKSFVADVNNKNSGVVDTLCRLIFTTINKDINLHNDKKHVISNESLQLVTDIISAMELNIVEEIMSNTSLAPLDKLNIILRISEYFMDKLIRNLMTTDEEVVTSTNSKRRLAPSTIKLARKKEIDSLIEHASFWINLVSQNIFTLSIEKFNSYISDYVSTEFAPVSNRSTDEELKVELRYCALKGKLEQCNNNIVDAYSWFEKCQSLLENAHEEINIDLGSMYDSSISKEGFEKKLNLLQIGKLYVAAKEKMNSNDFKGVINDLEDIFKPKMAEMDKIVDSEEDFQMINILSTAYFKIKRYVDAWNCYIRLFSCFMRKLVSYGEEQMQQEKRPSKHDDVEFFSIISHISDIMNSLVALIQEKNCEEWLAKEVDPDLTNSLIILLRMSTYYVFRHPDFVPLVNNFTSPDTPPHAPSKTTKSNGFNDLIIKSWVFHSYLLQYNLKTVSEDTVKSIMLSWAQLLQELHDELGEREICGASKSLFIHHLLETLVKVDNVAFRREIYQCYHCLYGVHLAAEADLIEEHHCSHGKLGQSAAESLFALVVDQATEKLRGGSVLKNDLKDVFETVSELYEELESQDISVKNNQTVIENYLNGDITIQPSFNMMLRTAIIPTRDIDGKKSKISDVLFKIFWMRGKTLRIQIRNRAKQNNEKNMIDLEKAIEEFTNHLTLNPDDADGWNELGICYQLLAEEELNWSASNIGAHKDLISEYQKKSFHSYLRGLYLHNSPSRKAEKYELLFNFGNLLYSMASSPMKMESFKPSIVKKKLGTDKKLTEVKSLAPEPKVAYKLATIIYGHALKYNTDCSEWRCHYMIGKCFSKLNRPPMEVYNWYLQAITRAKSKKSKHEHVLEPIYVLCSALVKNLYQGKIDAKSVEQILANEKEIGNRKTESASDDDVIYVGSSTDLPNNDATNIQILKELTQYSQHLPPETANAYKAIFARITEIRNADTKGLHHRPVYRIAWMYYYVYHNIDRAKSELMNLFTLRPTIKNHVNIWKPGFELAGKHYGYINKYTRFLIELSSASRDTNTLKHLYRKLRRAQTLLINDKEVFRFAYKSYLRIIDTDLKSIHRAEIIMDTIRSSHIEKEKFEMMCSAFVKSVSDDKSLIENSLYTILQDLAELRKLTQAYISPADTDGDGLNDVIQKCFAVVMFGGIHRAHKLQELNTDANADVEMSIAGTSENESNDAPGKSLLDVLLAQATVLMQSYTTTPR